jgi:hypothetical protein
MSCRYCSFEAQHVGVEILLGQREAIRPVQDRLQRLVREPLHVA